MASKKHPPLLSIGDETWGERLRRAWYRSKKVHGMGWKQLAQKVSLVTPVSDNGLMRFVSDVEKPRGKRLEMAYLMCLAMGVDPASLDINEDEIKTELFKSKEVRDLLLRPLSCLVITAA